MYFQKIYTPSLSINSYLIGDEKAKECAVIDPTRLTAPCIMAAESAGLTITVILETHVHADFVSGSKELKHQLKGKPTIYASGLGGKEWLPAYADVAVKEKDSVRVGSLRLEALHTPGHTPEHVMWIVYDEGRSKDFPWFVFSGDCLFIGSVGRPDLLGEQLFNPFAKQLYDSLFNKLAPFPDSLEIFPAHAEGSLCGKSLSGMATSTLGYERRCNPYYQKKQAEGQWIEFLKKGLPPVPPFFSRLKQLNAQGAPLLETLKTVSVNSEKELDVGALFLLDVRHPETFARFHLKGSVNIPVTPSFCQWVGWIIPSSTPIGLITGSENHAADIINQLRLIGLDQPVYTYALKESQEKEIDQFSSFGYLGAEDLSQRMHDRQENVFILDVRTPAERKSGHIAGSHHIELQNLYRDMHLIPQDCLVTVVCRTGMRASTAASLLKKYGFNQVANMKGGMQAWSQLKLPVIVPSEK